MRVVLSTRHVSGSLRLEAAEVCKELTAQNLTLSDKSKAAITDLCTHRLLPGAEHVLIAGEPPTQPTPPRASLVEPLAAAVPPVARKGETIASIVPPEAGKPGTDVFNQPRPPQPTPGVDTLIGGNVRLGEDALSIVADIDGIVHFDAQGRVSVHAVEQVEFDLYTPVSMQCATDLNVGGNIREGTGLRCAGSVYVGGDIEAAVVAHDVVVRGKIHTGPATLAAGGHTTVAAAHDIVAGTIASATVLAHGDVRIKDEIIRSTIACTGRLIAPHAIINASTLSITGSAECRVIGGDDHTRTLLEIGAQTELRKLITELLPQIEQRREHVEKVRRTIQPLLADAKRLTPEQKERATELLCDAELTEAEAHTMLERLTSAHDRFRATAGHELTIHELAHPGVVIRFVGVETALRMSLRGPIVIRAITDKPTPSIVCRYLKSSQELPLETRLVPDDPIVQLRHWLHQEARRQKAA